MKLLNEDNNKNKIKNNVKQKDSSDNNTYFEGNMVYIYIHMLNFSKFADWIILK